jgi:hypothetical protein
MNDRGRQGARIRAPEQTPGRRRTGGRVFGVGLFGDNKVGGDRFPGEISRCSATTGRPSRRFEKAALEGQRQAAGQGSGGWGEGSVRHSSVCQKGRLGREVRRPAHQRSARRAAPQAQDQASKARAKGARPPPLAPASQRHAPPNLPTKTPLSIPNKRNKPPPNNANHNHATNLTLTSITLPPTSKKQQPKTTTQTSLSKQTQNPQTTTQPPNHPIPTSIQLNPLTTTAEGRHSIVNVFGQPHLAISKRAGKPGGCARTIRTPIRSPPACK